MWPPNVPKPHQGLMRNKCSGKVDHLSVERMTDGKIKLITSRWSQMLFTPLSLSVFLTTHVHHSHPFLLLQVHPFGEIHHLGEFLPLHLGLQSIDFGWTISNPEQGEALQFQLVAKASCLVWVFCHAFRLNSPKQGQESKKQFRTFYNLSMTCLFTVGYRPK